MEADIPGGIQDSQIRCYGIPSSGTPSIADIRAIGRQVRFVPIPDSCTTTKFVLFATSLPRLSIGLRYHRIDRDHGFESRRQACRCWSNSDSWVAKPSQAVQYRRD
jgi:hypothetical protein